MLQMTFSSYLLYFFLYDKMLEKKFELRVKLCYFKAQRCKSVKKNTLTFLIRHEKKMLSKRIIKKIKLCV